MKGSYKVLIGLAATALILAVAMPSSLAQCPQAREFGAQGNGGLTERIKIATGAFTNDGNELGSLWQAGNAAINSGGPHFGGGDLCSDAVNDWYTTGGMFLGIDSGIQGFIASPTCQMNLCPGNGASLVTVVEDQSGDGSDAGFIAYIVQETPASVRWYDHGTTGDNGGAAGTQTTHVLQSFPIVDVGTSAGPPPNTTVTNTYAAVEGNLHVNPPQPGVVAYQIVAHHGPNDPGRARAGYNLGVIKSIPYAGAAIGDSFLVPCPTTVDDTWVSVGVEYVDGVQSVLAGAATRVECDPNVADPDDTPKIKTRRQMLGAGR